MAQIGEAISGLAAPAAAGALYLTYGLQSVILIDFATFLVECGIDSMSLISDTVIKTRLAVAAKEKELGIKP